MINVVPLLAQKGSIGNCHLQKGTANLNQRFCMKVSHKDICRTTTLKFFFKLYWEFNSSSY